MVAMMRSLTDKWGKANLIFLCEETVSPHLLLTIYNNHVILLLLIWYVSISLFNTFSLESLFSLSPIEAEIIALEAIERSDAGQF